MEPSTAQRSEECLVCDVATDDRCDTCRSAFCASHRQRTAYQASVVFGAFSVKPWEKLCPRCYRERLWHGWRGLAFVIGLCIATVNLLRGDWWVVPIVVLVVAGWWWLTAGPLARARAERDALVRAATRRRGRESGAPEGDA